MIRDIVLDIVGLYKENYVNVLSINEISKLLGKRYPFVHKKVKELIKEDILKSFNLGRAMLCSLNLENEFARHFLSFANLKLKSTKDVEDLNIENFEFIVAKYKKRVIKIYVISDKIKNNLNDANEIIFMNKEAFIDELINDEEFYKNHFVIKGFERFIEVIAKNKQKLQKYNPILKRWI
jgi:hypothetical protein